MDNLFAACASLPNNDDVIKSIKDITSNDKYAFKNNVIIHKNNHYIHLANYSLSHNTTVNNVSSPLKTIVKPTIEPSNVNNAIQVICNSRIDNKKDLLTRFIDSQPSVKKPDSFTDFNDSAFLACLFKSNINNLPEQLKGNFSYVIWNDECKTLHAAIDPFNTGSLFYMHINDVFYIASDAQVLASHSDVSLTVNKQAVVQWLSGRPDPNISMYNEIKRLPNGHQLVWSNNNVVVSKFWEVDANNTIRYKKSHEYEQHFHELLSASVSNRLASSDYSNMNLPSSELSAAPVFCQMSGGMDSTSITALANIEAKKLGCSLHTLSHSYKNTKSCNEMDNINDMIDSLKLSHSHFVELDKFDDVNFGQLYPTDFDNPGIVLSPKYHEELSLMKSLGASTLLTGNGGDEICWGHSSTYRSRLYKGDLTVVNEVIKACGELGEPVASSLVKLFVKPLVPNQLQNLVRLALNKPKVSNTDNPTSAWLTSEALSYIDGNVIELGINNPFNKTFEPAKYARFHSLKTTSTYNSMRSYQKVANQYGIDVRHPFFDVDVVELSFAIPDKMLIRGSYPKWLLRKTMEKHLPESVVWNKHKTVFDHHFANLVRTNEQELRDLLSHRGLHDLGLLDNDILLQAFDELVKNPDQHLNVDMLYAILTQSWYQTHCLNC